MEIGEEISTKIRAAIKAKLIDLGAYVDDELPDYIMVMVANKKTPQQMGDDLQLFLGSNTDIFTTWLNNVLIKLQGIAASDQTAVKKSESVNAGTMTIDQQSGQKDENNGVNDSHTSTSVTVKYKPSTRRSQESKPGGTFREEQKTHPGHVSSKEYGRGDTREDLDTIELTVKADDFNEEENRDRKPAPDSKKKFTKTQTKPVDQHQRLSVVGSVVKHNVSDDEDDSHDPSRMSSIIKVSRRRPSIPKGLQANKALLMRAVTDAEKSVEERKVTGSKTKTAEPLQLISRSRRQKMMGGQMKEVDRNIDRDVLMEVNEQDTHEPRVQDVRHFERLADMSPNDELLLDYDATTNGNTQRDEVADNRRIITTTTTSHQPANRPLSPKFIVTLDGVDRDENSSDANEAIASSFSVHSTNRPLLKKTFKRTSEDPLEINIPDSEDEFEGEYEGENNTSPRKKPRLTQTVTERCKFWPSCANGDDCAYIHPSTQCKAFPKCKFGDKCLFIHPGCKFEGNCSRSDCPFTHKAKRNLNSTPQQPQTFILAPPKLLIPTNTFGQSTLTPTRSGLGGLSQLSHHVQVKSNVCRFFPKCTNMNCPFEHPKPCRYGHMCRNRPGCGFSHPELPKKNQLKWRADQSVTGSHISGRQFSMKTTEHVPTPAI